MHGHSFWSRREAATRLGALLATPVFGRLSGTASRAPAAQDAAVGRPSPLGERSRHTRLGRTPGTTISSTPLQDLHGAITPSDLHYEVHHSGIPEIDPREHKLLVHGLVDRPLAFTVDDLWRFPSITRTCFIECSGNYRRNAPVSATPEMMAGLTSQSEWTGVSLRLLLDEVGTSPDASWLLVEGADRAKLDRSIPMTKARDDVFVAVAQNGEPLRPAQGYPLRLIVPGWEGNTHVKWLRRIEAGTRPFMTRWETSRYSDGLPDGRIRQFSFVMDARSIITSPAPPQRLTPGWTNITGLAWTGRGKIERVEISVDGGRRWENATLQQPILPVAHTRFGMPWRWDGDECVIMSRAIDETGYQQPTLAELLRVRGRDTGPYHLNPIVAWRITSSGNLEYRPEPES